jgi:hypothetical protein
LSEARPGENQSGHTAIFSIYSVDTDVMSGVNEGRRVHPSSFLHFPEKACVVWHPRPPKAPYSMPLLGHFPAAAKWLAAHPGESIDYVFQKWMQSVAMRKQKGKGKGAVKVMRVRLLSQRFTIVSDPAVMQQACYIIICMYIYMLFFPYTFYIDSPTFEMVV